MSFDPHAEPQPRRSFLRSCALAVAGLFGSNRLAHASRLLEGAGRRILPGDPDHPEVPNEEVAKIIDGIVRGRPFVTTCSSTCRWSRRTAGWCRSSLRATSR